MQERKAALGLLDSCSVDVQAGGRGDDMAFCIIALFIFHKFEIEMAVVGILAAEFFKGIADRFELHRVSVAVVGP